jgi:hypothetical protein
MYILRYMRLCKTRFSQKLFHFYLHKERGNSRIALLFILNMFDCSFIILRKIAAYKYKYFFIFLENLKK